MQVRLARAVAGGFLSDQVEQAEVSHPFAHQPFSRHDLRGQAPLGVTCSAPINELLVLAGEKERRDGVDVRAQNNIRLSCLCEHVGAIS